MHPANFITFFLVLLSGTVPVMADQLHTLHGRDTTDTCNYVNTRLTALAGLISVPINQCLCLGGVSSFLQGSLLAALINALGANTVTTNLNNLILGPGAKTCTYPTNSVAACTQSNVCGFTCTAGHILCSGRCITSTTGVCPSVVPANARRRTRRDECAKKGEKACGILGRGPRSWECIDIKSDLESCGGCMISLIPHLDPPAGRDCSIIPHVSSVSCVSGKCQVETCSVGYQPSPDGDMCVPVIKASNDTQAYTRTSRHLRVRVRTRKKA